MRNPVWWLRQYRDGFVLSVHQCITHGDLTGRNIMVDETGKCWLIDFYRTYRSHILRDFVVLETDILYRLLPLLSMIDFLKMQDVLMEADRMGMMPTLPSGMSSEVQKAIHVVFTLRQMAHEFARSLSSTPEMARREFPMPGVTVNGLVVGATVVTLSRYYRQFVIQGPGAFVEEAADYADFERAMRRKLLRELGVIEMSGGG